MRYLSLFLIVILFAASGCGPNFQNIGKESDPTRFYTLHTTQQTLPESGKARPELIVGVGPIYVADYLDRSHIVVRKSATQLELADFDRWASAADKEIQRVMGANLAALVGTERIVMYPWKSDIIPHVSVEVNVERFEYAEDRKVHLTASWQVFDAQKRVPMAFKRAELSQAAEKNYEDITERLSDLVGQLSQEIANTIRTR